jgi:hypothetical protein
VFLPKRIVALNGLHVVSVAAGFWHALALTRCGRVYSWGAYTWLPLGRGSITRSHDGDYVFEDVDCCTPAVITAAIYWISMLVGHQEFAPLRACGGRCSWVFGGSSLGWVVRMRASPGGGHTGVRVQNRRMLAVVAGAGVRCAAIR